MDDCILILFSTTLCFLFLHNMIVDAAAAAAAAAATTSLSSSIKNVL
jgi:hypothetical protein